MATGFLVRGFLVLSTVDQTSVPGVGGYLPYQTNEQRIDFDKGEHKSGSQGTYRVVHDIIQVYQNIVFYPSRIAARIYEYE